jgi:hypothetical protein
MISQATDVDNREAVRLPSTRHLTATEDQARIIGVGAGLAPDVAIRAFTGEPIRMVLAVAAYHEDDPERNVHVLEWARDVGRGNYNPDPTRYLRDADVVPIR